MIIYSLKFHRIMQGCTIPVTVLWTLRLSLYLILLNENKVIVLFKSHTVLQLFHPFVQITRGPFFTHKLWDTINSDFFVGCSFTELDQVDYIDSSVTTFIYNILLSLIFMNLLITIKQWRNSPQNYSESSSFPTNSHQLQIDQ